MDKAQAFNLKQYDPVRVKAFPQVPAHFIEWAPNFGIPGGSEKVFVRVAGLSSDIQVSIKDLMLPPPPSFDPNVVKRGDKVTLKAPTGPPLTIVAGQDTWYGSGPVIKVERPQYETIYEAPKDC